MLNVISNNDQKYTLQLASRVLSRSPNASWGNRGKMVREGTLGLDPLIVNLTNLCLFFVYLFIIYFYSILFLFLFFCIPSFLCILILSVGSTLLAAIIMDIWILPVKIKQIKKLVILVENWKIMLKMRQKCNFIESDKIISQ